MVPTATSFFTPANRPSSNTCSPIMAFENMKSPGFSSGGAGGGDRRQPRKPRTLHVLERHDGTARIRRGPISWGEKAGRGWNHLRLSEVRPYTFPRGRSVERLSRGNQRTIRHRQEDDAGSVAGLPRAVRYEQRGAFSGQSLRPARQFQPPVLARDPRAYPQMRRGAGGWPVAS